MNIHESNALDIRWIVCASYLVRVASENDELVKNWERLSKHRLADCIKGGKKAEGTATAFFDFVKDCVWDRLANDVRDDLFRMVIEQIGLPDYIKSILAEAEPV